jgi:hypothetical protein
MNLTSIKKLPEIPGETQAQADRFATALDDGAVTKEAEVLAEDLEAA